MDIIKNLFYSLRPKQWVKNLFIFAALLFSLEFNNKTKIAEVFVGFGLFCVAASSVYLINDIVDRVRDREHPIKRFRPVASGALPVSMAIIVAILFILLALIGGFLLQPVFALIVAGYIILNFLYSFWLKHIVIIDVLSIACGFVLRVIGGAVIIAVPFSPWLIFCTFFLTLFLAISKRRNELRLSEGRGSRSVLNSYSLAFIDQMNIIVLPLTLITYTFYTFSSEHSRLLMLTVPIVLYGLLRYMYVNERRPVDNDGPTDALFADGHLQMTIILWIFVVIVILLYAR